MDSQEGLQNDFCDQAGGVAALWHRPQGAQAVQIQRKGSYNDMLWGACQPQAA